MVVVKGVRRRGANLAYRAAQEANNTISRKMIDLFFMLLILRGNRIPHRITAMFLVIPINKWEMWNSKGLDSGLYERSNIRQITIQDNSPYGGICFFLKNIFIASSF